MGSFFHGLSFIFPHLLDHSVEISVLICLIFLVKIVVSKKLPPWWHYSLWLLLLVRMLVPVEFENQLNIFNFVPTVSNHQVSELISPPSPEGGVPVQPVVLKPQVVEAELRFAVTKSIPVIWLTGAMILGICIVFESITFWRYVRRRPKVTDEDILSLLSECKRRMKIKRHIDIVVTDNVRSPALFGYFRPRLLLPEGIFEKLSDRELSYAFMHELGHMKRHDIGVSWLVALLQVIHWFNPLVWLAFYQIRIDQESACDAAVLARMNPRQSADYAKAIVGFLEKFCHNCQLPALAGILENRSQMKKRIAKIVQYRKASQKLSFIAFILLASAGFMLFTLTGVAAEKRGTASSDMEMASFEPQGHTKDRRIGDAENLPEGFRNGAPGMDYEVMPEREILASLQLGALPIQVPENQAMIPQHPTPSGTRVIPDDAMENAGPGTEAIAERMYVALAETTPFQSSMTARQEEMAAADKREQEKPAPAKSTETAAVAASAAAPEHGFAGTEKPHAPLNALQEQAQKVVEQDKILELAALDGAGLKSQAASETGLQESVDPLYSPGYIQERIEGDTARGDVPPLNMGNHTGGNALAAVHDMSVQASGGMETRHASSMTASQGPTGTPAAFQAAEVDTPPQLIKSYPPRYPYIAKRDDISGSITLQFVVTEDGSAVGTTVVQSEPKGVFDQAALQAIELYRFKPGIKDGKAVNVRVNLPIKFNLS